MGFVGGFIIGVFTGAAIGVFTLAIFQASRDEEEKR